MDDTRSYFEQMATRWDESSPERTLVLERLSLRLDRFLPASGTLLEVGTGTGILIPFLFQRHPQIQLVSLDLAFNMLQRARQRETQASLVQADGRSLPFPNSCFAAVICHNSFPHFGDYPAALQELQRVVQPGGNVIIAHDIGRERVNAVHMHIHAGFIHHHLLPSGQELTGLFKQVGLTPVQMEDESEYYLAFAVK